MRDDRSARGSRLAHALPTLVGQWQEPQNNTPPPQPCADYNIASRPRQTQQAVFDFPPFFCYNLARHYQGENVREGH